MGKYCTGATHKNRVKKNRRNKDNQKKKYGEKRSSDYDDVHEIENFLNYETN